MPSAKTPPAADPSQADREAERARTAQTTVPPGFDAVPRPPGAPGENITLLPNAPDDWNERAITVKKGESAATILRDLGASAEDIRSLAAVLGARGRDGGLREGQKLRILFAPDGGRLRVVRVVVAGDSAVEAVVALSDTGKYVAVAPGASSGVLAPLNPIPLQPAPPASQPVSRPPPAAPSSSARVVLYEEDPADPQGNRYVGSAIWRTETVSPGPGEPADLAVLADLEIPDLRITMTFTLRRNRDKALPASHTIEVKFNLPADFAFGGISNVPGILMKQAEQTRGAPLAGLAVKVTSGFFLVGLSAVEADMQRNLQLLKERAWFDVPIVYNNGRRAILALEKGNPGERALEEALKAWKQTSADLAPSSGVLAPSPGVANPNPLQVVPQAAQPAADPSQAELAWAVTKDTTTIAVLEEFVRRYGDSHYAALARARMEELRKSQAAAPPLVPPGAIEGGQNLMPPGVSSGVLAPSPLTANPSPLQLAPPASQPAAPQLVPLQSSVFATNEPKRVKTVTIRTEVASRPPATAFGPPAVAPAGAYLVQVSAQKSEAEAQSSYRILQQKYPSVLGGREPTIRRAEIGQNSVWYRVHVGSFATSEQATAFCNNLKDAGGQCIVQRDDWGGPGPGEPPAASLRGGSAIAENSEAMKYENKKTTPDAAEPPLHAADTLTRGVTIDERGCKARFHGMASEGLRLAADCAKGGDDAAPTARQTETPPSARGREVPAVRPQPVSVEPRERERKAAEPRRASVERRPALVPRQAKPRGSAGRCFVHGGRSFCE